MLCKEFGWTYKDLMQTPWWFADEMIDVIDLVKKHKSLENG